jgi:uncharacterized protein YlxP (DUF503 family)
MFVGAAELVLHVPHSRSLKAKRAVVNALKGRIQTRLHVSVSEVADQDLWQRATLGVAVVSGDVGQVEEMLQAVRRLAEGSLDGHLVSYRQEITPWPS